MSGGSKTGPYRRFAHGTNIPPTMALLQLKILEHLFDVGEVSVLQEMGFPCDGETPFIKIPPWWSTPGLMPIPGKVSPIISLIITSSPKNSTWPFMSGLEGEEVAWVRLGEVLSGSPSLTIRVWFSRHILSTRIQPKGMVQLLSTLCDCLHLGNNGLLQVPPIHGEGLGALFWCQ